MRSWIIKLGLALLIFTGTLVRADAPPPPRVPVNQWFEEPETRLTGWTVQTAGPVLTFPLRWGVAIKGTANVRSAKLVGHDVYFFVKVADSSGHWFPERRYSAIQQLQKGTDITVTERFFAKPGDYVVALVVYDGTNNTHGVWKRQVHVPELDVPISYPKAAAVQFIDADEPFRPGNLPSAPSIQNQKPMRVDIIVNLTERTDLEVDVPRSILQSQTRRGGWGVFNVLPDWQMDRPRQDFVTETLLSIGDAISAIKVNGCTRVSIVDAVRAKVLLDRRTTFDPNSMMKDMRERRSTHKIDAHVLALRQQAGTFLHNFLQTINDDNTACPGDQPQSERAIVLISDALVFPESKQLTPVSPPAAEPPSKFYFFRLTVHEYVQRVGMGRVSTTVTSPEDQVGRLLSNLSVQRFDLTQPKDFQKALTKYMDSLKP